jgi:hypothetical protein
MSKANGVSSERIAKRLRESRGYPGVSTKHMIMEDRTDNRVIILKST